MNALARRIGLRGAVAMGLGSMIGAGVFSAVAPAARSAGSLLLASLVLAAFVAWMNATSVSRLAAIYPESGGAYVYGRARLGRAFGVVAGAVFVLGKLSSAAAMALTFGAYVDAAHRELWAMSAVALMTAVNYLGVRKTVGVTTLIVIAVFVALLIGVSSVWLGSADPSRLTRSASGVVPLDVLHAAGLLFFAFAGYARIATLGEEVIDPAKTIPRAIHISLAITFVIYAVVMTSALAALDRDTLAASATPLADATGGGTPALIVRAGAVVSSIGVLLSLIAGISRTMFAMAKNGDLPRGLALVHPKHEVPHRAIVLAGVGAAAIAVFGGIGGAISVSSFFVLIYYAIANAAALTLPDRSKLVPALGLAACLAIAIGVALP